MSSPITERPRAERGIGEYAADWEANAQVDARFAILSDPDHSVHDQWGTYGEKLLYGKPVIGAIRSTFVLDEDGVITHTFYATRATGHVAMLKKQLGLTA